MKGHIVLYVFIPERRTWGLCKLLFADRLNSGGLRDWALATAVLSEAILARDIAALYSA